MCTPGRTLSPGEALRSLSDLQAPRRLVIRHLRRTPPCVPPRHAPSDQAGRSGTGHPGRLSLLPGEGRETVATPLSWTCDSPPPRHRPRLAGLRNVRCIRGRNGDRIEREKRRGMKMGYGDWNDWGIWRIHPPSEGETGGLTRRDWGELTKVGQQITKV